jgi:uncharacterized protein (TIGR02757 family)
MGQTLGERLHTLQRNGAATRLARDPLGLVRRARDREAAALLAASLAFGNVKAIRASATAAIEAFEGGGAPPRGFRHRWVGARDLGALFTAIRRARDRHGSLEALFRACDDPAERDVAPALDGFLASLRGPAPTPALRFLLPLPRDGSACKRPLLFLRWVARPDDGCDLGLWPGVLPRRLLVPLDTHVHRIAYWLALTSRRTPDLRAAREVTASLARFDPGDPTRFDFALAHLGIAGDCPRRPVAALCRRCPLRPWCRAWVTT